MLAYYYLNLVFVSWNIIRWLLERRKRFASVPSGRSPEMTSGTPAVARRTHAIIGNANASRWFERHDGRAVTRAQGRDGAGAFTDIVASVPPGNGVPTSQHKQHDNIFKVLEGKFRFQCAGDVFDVAPGTTVVVARGVEYGWKNSGLIPGRIAFSFSPGGGDFVDCTKTGTARGSGSVTATRHFYRVEFKKRNFPRAGQGREL